MLSYTAAVTCAVVTGTDASFWFAIPAGVPSSGLGLIVKVHDGGTPGTNGDTWAHGVSDSCVDGPVTSYPVTAGNLVVRDRARDRDGEHDRDGSGSSRDDDRH